MIDKILSIYENCNFNFEEFSNSKDELSYLFDEYILLLHDIEILHVLVNPKAFLFSGVFNMMPTVSIYSEEMNGA
jgi:hypothetical protein